MGKIIITSTRRPTPAMLDAVFQAAGMARSRDLKKLAGMISGADIMATAWDENKLIGEARGLTDYSHVFYLADLAVGPRYHGQNIGKRLIAKTRELLPGDIWYILLALDSAKGFYAKLGFKPDPDGYFLPPNAD